MTQLIRIALVALALSTTGCTAIDKAMNPRKYMTPEERAVYDAEQAAKKADQERRVAELNARRIQDFTTPGEGHDGPFDHQLAGRYWFDHKLKTRTVPLFHKQKRDAEFRQAGELTLFINGSYARKITIQEWEGEDWSSSVDLSGYPIERGQWKTENGRFYVRTVEYTGYSDWVENGPYERQPNGTLAIVHERQIERETSRLGQDADPDDVLLIVFKLTRPWKPR